MGIKHVTIELDPVETTASSQCYGYIPGHVVSGTVVVWGTSKVNLNGSYIEVEGRAKVAWNENDVSYCAQNSYLNLKILLTHDSSPSAVFTNGVRFPFKFALPLEIPSSYEGKSGNIRYSIKAVLRRRSLFKFDNVSRVYFTVNAIVDLSKDETSSFPLRESLSKPRSGLKRIMADAWLDKTGYIPGEEIQFNATIDNYSGKSVRGTTVQLIQYTIFTDGKHKNKVKKVLWERKGKSICDKEVQVWERFPIMVPHVPSSGMPFCDLINTSYVIKLIVNPGFFCRNLTIRLNIVIGTVRSIAHQNSSNLTLLPAISRLDRTLTSNLFSSVGELHFSSPPPTYEECELGKSSCRDFTADIKTSTNIGGVELPGCSI
ncbi:arrestin domain-containing protein 17 isoform X1 [Daphnia magna]|uniref:arrestin domain-containing protein 17 isoform X1 n=1 Tax=Daphnia magna TaxID=35525 RepID=UPI001E1BB82F|nr:arrestin domain-containing protein 17 isoform X1 [Daphnia magna]